MEKALLFLPEAGIYAYLRSISILGDALKKNGYDVYLAKCDGSLFRCLMMPCCQMPANVSEDDKKEKCKMCQKNYKNAIKKYNFKTIDVAEFTDKKFIDYINSLLNIEKQFWPFIEYKDFKVGQISILDLIYETKILSTENMNDEQWKIYENYIKNTALMLEISQRVIAKLAPSIVLTFSNYSENQSIQYICNKNNINYKAITHQLHLGANCSLVQISDSILVYDNLMHFQNWSSQKDISISDEKVLACFEDAIFKMYSAGSHIFSPIKNKDNDYIFEELKLDQSKKIIGVFTSSYDERISAEIILKIWGKTLNIEEVFHNQIEWLKFLREFSKKQNDIQFVVRIHPREGKNNKSEHLKLLKKEFTENLENFKIIWPDDKISSYDLLELIDACLVASSTVGLECQRLGIPTLGYIKNFTYPNQGLIDIAVSIDDYKNKLEHLFNKETPIETLIKVARFYNWSIFVNTFDFGKEIPKDFNNDLIYPPVPPNKQKILVDILENKTNLAEYNLGQLLIENNTPENELKAAKLGIRKIIDKIFSSMAPPKKSFWQKQKKSILKRFKINLDFKEKFSDYTLIYSEDLSKLNEFIQLTNKNKKMRVILKDDIYAILVEKGKVIKRKSKLINNLARIHEKAN